MTKFISYVIPVMVLLILVSGVFRKVKCFDSFISGAKEGATTIVKLLPSLVGLIVAISVFRASGALDILVSFLHPVTSFLGLDDALVPFLIMRPVSGSGSLALLADIFKTYGADSKAGMIASVMMGSTETILYTLTVYTQNTRIRKTPNVLTAALIASFASAFYAGVFISLLFGI